MASNDILAVILLMIIEETLIYETTIQTHDQLIGTLLVTNNCLTLLCVLFN
jgi:hypothetical protein